MQTIVMTGATRGIGKVAVRQLATATSDLTLVLLARNSASLAWVRDEVGDSVRVHLLEAELNSMASTTAAADQVVKLVTDGTVPAISALVLNAGIQHVSAQNVSADGLEDTFAVNVVANHLLVQALAPHMQPGGRIVVTVSDTHFGDLRHNLGMVPGPQWTDPRLLAQPGTRPESSSVSAGRIAYSTSKLAAIYQVHEYARRYPELTVLAYNPGFVPGTGLARDAGPASRFAMAHLLPLLARTPIASTAETAGKNLAKVAAGRDTFPTGAYINLDRAESSSVESYDPDREKQLIEYLDSLTESSEPSRG